MELRLRTRRDQVRGTERALTAIDTLFKTAGGNSLRLEGCALGGLVCKAQNWTKAN